MSRAIAELDILYDEGWLTDAEYNKRLDEIIADYNEVRCGK